MADDSKKRKRSANDTDTLEIDVNLPEPLSRKEARRAKKGKLDKPVDQATITLAKKVTVDGGESAPKNDAIIADGVAQRSGHGIWIGNLPFHADKDSLRTFLLEKGDISEASITRLHLPAPQGSSTTATGPRAKPKNKGFAYIDFDGPETLGKALELTEQLLGGRKVLIKDAKSFEGRPEKSTTTDAKDPTGSQNAKSKRVFIGNLSFDHTKEDLQQHFEQAGSIEDIHVATFIDSGKCKGYAWVTFTHASAAADAVRGFLFKAEEDDREDSSTAIAEHSIVGGDEPTSHASRDESKKTKARKWFINRMSGRTLRCEFAEDPTTRYNKRYKNKPKSEGNEAQGYDTNNDGVNAGYQRSHQHDSKSKEGLGMTREEAPMNRERPRGSKEERQEQRRKKHIDARQIRPGAALANAPRASGAIVDAAGTKTKFDD